jgi:hypothetical protein
MPAITYPAYKDVPVRFFGAAVYAFYLVTFGQTLRWQLFSDEGWQFRRNRQNIILTATILIFAFTTIYIALGLQEGMQIVYSAVYEQNMPGFAVWLSTIGVSTDSSPCLPIDQVLTFATACI